MEQLTLIQPDDWHLHVRDGAMLSKVIAHTARQFGRAIIMPNLKPAITTTEAAAAYRARILAAIPPDLTFEPLMTLYLTERTTAEEITRAKTSGYIHGAKLYPAGATTHSDAGVTEVRNIYPVLEAMEQHRLPLLIHGEVTTQAVDIFDRERAFIDTTLAPLTKRFPALRIVLEHVTTQDAVVFVTAANTNVAATITPHHLLLNRNDMLVGGIRPHHYCLPVLKREQHRQALVRAATSGNSKFFLGTDSAPHPKHAKESACGCAGIYSAHAALELYAEAFEQAGALDKLEGFASQFGADFYGLPRNARTVTLRKENWQVPDTLFDGNEVLVPLFAGRTLRWKVV